MPNKPPTTQGRENSLFSFLYLTFSLLLITLFAKFLFIFSHSTRTSVCSLVFPLLPNLSSSVVLSLTFHCKFSFLSCKTIIITVTFDRLHVKCDYLLNIRKTLNYSLFGGFHTPNIKINIAYSRMIWKMGMSIVFYLLASATIC